MVLKRCPHCNVVYAHMPGIGDFVHNCNSGNPGLDNEDTLKLDSPQWNLQGVANKASPVARIEGADIDDRTRRGNIKNTHTTSKHHEYIKLD